MEALVPLVFNYSDKTVLDVFTKVLIPKLKAQLKKQRNKRLQENETLDHPKFDLRALEKLHDRVFAHLSTITNVSALVKGKPIVSSIPQYNYANREAFQDGETHPDEEVEENYSPNPNMEDGEYLYELFEKFIQDGILAETSIEKVKAIRKFSRILLELDDHTSAKAPSLEEKYLVCRLQKQIVNRHGIENITDELSAILTSSSALLLPTGKLKSNIPSETFELIREWISSTPIKFAHKTEEQYAGNAADFHKNATNLIAIKPTNNIHEAVSKVLFGSPAYTEIIQMACYQILKEFPVKIQECLQWTNNSISNLKAAKVNTLLNLALPHQLTIATLAQVIERNIILHIGSHSDRQSSLSFGNYENKTPIELLELDKKIYPLIPVHGLSNANKEVPVINGNECLPNQSIWSLRDPTFKDFGEFSSEMDCFFKVCSFCKEYGTEVCTHISPPHIKAFSKISETLLNNNYGTFEQEDIPISHIDEVARDFLPESLSSNFEIIKTDMDGDCLFSACSYYLTKSYDMSIPLRRSTQIEYNLNRNSYQQYYKRSNIPLEEVKHNHQVLNSLTKWGNSFSIALLSRITNRKIIVFQPNNVHVTYDTSRPTSTHPRPMFLFLHNNHFQPLIPKKYSKLLIPAGKSNQYKIINEEQAKCPIHPSNVSVGLNPTQKQTITIGTGKLSNREVSVILPPQPSADKKCKVMFPWKRPVTEEENLKFQSLISVNAQCQENAPLQIQVSGQTTEIPFEVNDKNILATLHLNTRNKIPAQKIDDYVLFTNCILQDIRNISKTDNQEDFIRVFVQRCSFDSFWNSNVMRVKGDMYKKKYPTLKEAKNKAKSLMTSLQTSDLARELTIEILARAKFTREAITLYSNLMQVKMNQIVAAKARGGSLMADLDALLKKTRAKTIKRELPGYNFEGLMITQNLEKEMRTKMDAQSVLELEYRIDNLQLPDEFGKQTIETFSQLQVKTDIKNIKHLALNESRESSIDNDHDGKKKSNGPLPGKESLRNKIPEKLPSHGVVNNERVITVTLDNTDTPLSNPEHFQVVKQQLRSTIHSMKLIPDTSDIEFRCETSLSSEYSEEEESEEEDLRTKLEIVNDMFPASVLNFVPPEEFTMKIPATEMKTIFNYNTSKFISGEWTQTISKHLTINQGVCTFKTRHVPEYFARKTSGFSVMNGYCGCKLKFKVKVVNLPRENEPVTFEVTSEGKFRLVQSKFCGRQLKGEERRKLGEKLIHNMPTKILLEHIAVQNPLHLLHNTTQLHSLQALQQLRHETLKSASICLDPMSDLNAFKKETEDLEKDALHVKGFIHLIKESQDNMQIHMYTEMALRLLQSSQRSKNTVLFVDATGSITFPVNNKQMLFYLAFLETNKGHIFPVATSLAHRGRAIDIADLFIKVKGDLKRIKTDNHKPLAGVIVTDFSFAMLTGVLQGANTMELRDYIVHASNVIMDKTSFDNMRSVVFICTSHLIHSFSRLLKKHVPTTREYKTQRNLAMHSLARLQACKDFQSYQKSVSCIIECFGLENFDEEKLEQNIDYLKGESEIDYDNDQVQENADEDIVDFNDHELLREKSPFYHEFIKIKTTIMADKCTYESQNPLYLPIVVQLFEKFYCPFFPLWSASILEKSGRYHKGSLTNGMVESEFNTIKNNFHHKQKLPFNSFIRQHYTYFTGRVREVLLPDSQRSRRIKKRFVRGEKRYFNQSEEKWSKKARNDTNRYVGKNVFKLPKKRQSMSPSAATTKQQAQSIVHNDSLNGHTRTQFYSPRVKAQDMSTFQTTYRTSSLHSNCDASDMSTKENLCGTDYTASQTQASSHNCGESFSGSSFQNKTNEVTDHSLPRDELARVPYRASKIIGQKFDQEFVTFRSNQLADLCNPNHWIDFDEMDRLLQYSQAKKTDSQYIVSEVHFAWKQKIDNSNSKSDWHSLFQFDDTDDQSRCVDPRKSTHILHPLFMNSHWSLLQINKLDGSCTVYDSMNRNLAQLQEINKNVLPLFELKTETIKWNTKYANNFPLQHDSSSCGLYTFESSKLILQRQIPTTSTLQHVRNVHQTRIKLVRELLQTTIAGQQLLSKCGNDDIRLETTLKIVHEIYQEKKILADEYRKKADEVRKKADEVRKKEQEQVKIVKATVNTCKNKNPTGKTDNANLIKEPSDSIKLKPFEVIYNDPAILSASLSMLEDMEAKTYNKNQPLEGKACVEELMRRLDDAKGHTSQDDLEFDENGTNIKKLLVPQYAGKEELYNQHCMAIKKMGKAEIINLCRDIVPQLKDVMAGKITSLRNQIFKKPYLDRNALNKLCVVAPFNDHQDLAVGLFLIDRFVDDDVDFYYANYVLKPEALTRIYALKCNLSLEHAEKELRFGAAYDGDTPLVLKTAEN